MSPARAALAVLLPLACPAWLQAQGVTIEHKPVACIVAGKYPRLNACFRPAGAVVKPRVNFKMKDAPAAYYTEMQSDMPCHVGYLPRPKKELIGQEIEIWLEGLDLAFNPARTPEYTVKVVGSEAECKDLPVAPWVSNAAVAVFPGMAPGFVASAPSLGLLAAAGGTVAAGTGAYVATRSDDPPPPPVVTPTPAPVPTPAATPAPTPTPTPTPTPPPGTLAVDCTIRPRTGAAPLTVSFSAVVSGFTGPVDYRWDFGDGTVSTDRDTTHTYTRPGVFNAIVTATGGGQTARCDRNVSVSRPEDVRHGLDVALAGSGSGTVMSSPPGISCPPDCDEVFASDTVVTLTAVPASGSFFVGWTGACSGAGPCTVTMNADQAVTAKFEPKPAQATVTVTTSGKGSGSVTADPPLGGIACPSDCTETYALPATVTLRATPQTNSFFAGWSGGGCTGTGPCTIALSSDTTVDAQFEPIQVRVNLICGDGRPSRTASTPAGSVSVTPGALSCASDPVPVTASNTYSAGTTLTFTATSVPGTGFIAWGRACAFAGSTTASPATCVLTLPPAGPVEVTVNFTNGAPSPIPVAPLAARERAPSDAEGIALAWRHQLDVAGAAGQVLLNGATTVASGPGLHSAQALGRPGENRIEGRLIRGGRAGTWRFELGSNLRLEPGSLRVLAGEPAVVTGDAIVFRLRGQAGEQVAFTFRLKR